MMKWIIHPIQSLKEWGVKKFVLGIVNTALKAHEASITRSREIVMKANEKLKAVSRFLDGLNMKLSDNQITEEEGVAAIEDATRLAKELTR